MNKHSNSTKLTCLVRYKLRGVQDAIVEYRPQYGWYVRSPLVPSTSPLPPIWIGNTKYDAFNYIYHLPNDPILALSQLLSDHLAALLNMENELLLPDHLAALLYLEGEL